MRKPFARRSRFSGQCKIRGQVTARAPPPAVQIDRYDRRPDRAAQWALFMGIFMVVVAIVTGT